MTEAEEPKTPPPAIPDRMPNAGPYAGPSLGPAIRRLPGWIPANAILARKNQADAERRSHPQVPRRPQLHVPRRPQLHVPRRPLWLCRACAQPWPCGEARVRLIREYAHDRIALRIYLASRMHESIDDLLTLDPQGAPTAEAFFARFLAWAAPTPGAN